MSDWKSETKTVLGELLVYFAKSAWREARRCAIYAAVGAVLLGGATYAAIGELWFGVKLGALLGVIVALGLRALFRGGLFD